MSVAEKGLSPAGNKPDVGKCRCYFALCGNCLWCASLFGSSLAEPLAEKIFCPNCHFDVEMMPLADREVYRLEFPESGGLELEFSR